MVKYSIIAAILVLSGCAQQSDLDRIEQSVELVDSTYRIRYEDLSKRLDKQDSLNRFLTQENKRLDSLTGDRNWKRDRAARRGEFWGSFSKKLVGG